MVVSCTGTTRPVEYFIAKIDKIYNGLKWFISNTLATNIHGIP